MCSSDLFPSHDIIGQQSQAKKTVKVGTDAEIVWQAPMNDTAILEAGPEVKDYANFWKSVKIRFYNPSTGQSKEAYANYLTSNSNTQTITTDKITTVFPAGNSLEGYTTIQGIYVGKFPGDEELYRNSLKINIVARSPAEASTSGKTNILELLNLKSTLISLSAYLKVI